MTSDPPVSFEQAAKSGGNPANGGYPYQIRGTDLDKNFVFASLVVADGLVDQTTGAGGHSARRLKIPNPPEEAEGLFLQADLSWAEPVEKGNFKGQFLRWDSAAKKWVRFSGSAEGAFPQWDATNGWESQGAGTNAGQLLKWNAISKNWGAFSGSAEGAFPQWDATNGWESQGAGTAKGQFLKWDPQAKNWVPFSGSAEGAFPQWDATNGWESQGAGTNAGQLMKWNSAAKNWVAGPSGTVDNELLRWNATSDTWEPFGRGATDGQLLVAQSGGWVPFTAPPNTGTHVLGAVNGTLQWIATEEC
jgi:hypothetical protein